MFGFRRSRLTRLLLVALGGVVVGCSSEDPDVDPPGVPPQTCFTPNASGSGAAGDLGRPESIDGTVALINAMPKPLTLPCLLQALERPLHVVTTYNDFSLQPAFGRNNPRVFIERGRYLLSIVPKGEGRSLLEMSERSEAARSVKAELLFPVTEELQASAPFDRIVAGSGGETKCQFCHLEETPVAGMMGRFESKFIAINPSRSDGRDYLQWLHDNCDRALEPDRCAMIDGVFGYGAYTVDTAFAPF